MRRAALLTPNGWAVRGFADLAVGGAGTAVILPCLVALLVFAAVTMVPTMLLARRLVRT